MVDVSQALQALLTEVIRFIPNLITAVITLLAALLVAGPLARATKRATEQRIDNEDIVRLLSRLVRWTVIVFGVILALGQVNFDVTGFIAGLGVAGITLGFALQDIARNFVAGLLLFLRQPFQIGDAVKAGGYSGAVEDITSRDTVIRSWDGEKVIIANIDILENPIVNYSNLTKRRRTVYLGIGYGQDIRGALDVFAETVRGVEGVMAEPPPELIAEQLGDSAVQVAVRFWVNPETHNLFQVHSDVVLALDQAAARESIDLPYPIQTVRIVKPETETTEEG
ncbi:MAG: mechanosensitive ion channel family protein [Anaerolineae bacterium]